MIFDKVQIVVENQVYTLSLNDEIPEEVVEKILLVARYTLKGPSDISLYKYGNFYITTLYDTTTEVIWSISDDPFEALDYAFRNLVSIDDAFGVLKGCLEGSEDSKLEAEKLVRDYEELKEAFNKLREEVEAEINMKQH